jgi:hypothetical protein
MVDTSSQVFDCLGGAALLDEQFGQFIAGDVVACVGTCLQLIDVALAGQHLR